MESLFLVKLKKNWKKVVIVMALLFSFVAMVLFYIPIRQITPANAVTLPTDYWSSYQAAYDGGIGSEQDPYLISKPEQLAKFSAAVNAGSITTKKYLRITRNINLSSHLWVPIGTSAHPFNGVIDGNNFAIAGLTQNSALEYTGLVGYAGEVEIKNINLSGVDIINTSTSVGAVGAIVGIANSPNNPIKFSNIVVTGVLETKVNYPSVYDSLGSLIGSVIDCQLGSIIQNVIVNTTLKAPNRNEDTCINPLIGYIRSTNTNLNISNVIAQSSITISSTTVIHKKYDGNFGGNTTNNTFTFINGLNGGLPIFKSNYWITATNQSSYNKTGTEIEEQLTTLGFTTGALTKSVIHTLTRNAATNGSYLTSNRSGAVGVLYGEKVSVTPTPNTGYIFSSINVNSNVYSGTTEFTMPNQNSTLNVIFSPISYTVTYVGNGSTSGSTANSTHTYDQAKQLNANGFGRAYTVTYNLNYTGATDTSATVAYTFSGWKSSVASGFYGSTSSPETTVTLSSVIEDQNYVKNLTATNGGSVTMTAQWTSVATTLKTPTRTGYTFDGWYGESACTNKIGNGGASYTPVANKTLYAKWTKNNYTVTVDPNGGTWSSETSAQSFTQALGTTKTIADPTRAGYTFKGWVIYKNAYSADWVEILYHNNENGAVLFSNETDAKTARSANKLSLLSDMAKYKYNDKFEYLLEYDNISGYNRWTQTSDPTTTSNSVTGYNAVNVSWTANSWAGIAKSTETAKTFIDGSPGNANWWYAIGSYQKFTSSDGTVGIPASTISEKGGEHLWVRVADASLSNLTGITTDCLDASNNYYFSAQNVTIKAVWSPNNYLLTLDNNYDSNLTSVYSWGKNSSASGSWAHSSNIHTFTFTATPSSASGPYFRLLHHFMTNGHKYRITISAKASRTINSVPMRYEAATGTNSKNINLTTSYQSFTLDVTYSNSTTYQAFTFYSAAWMSGDTFSIQSITISQIVTYNSAFGNLPGNMIDGNTSTRSTMRDYYTLKGWYTAASGGTQVADASGVLKANVSGYTDANKNWINVGSKTVYAQWTVNQYDLTLTLGTGISRIYYKVNGASSFSYKTSNSTVKVNYGSTWYAYATASNGYTYTAYSSSSPISGTMSASGATYNPSGTAKIIHITLDKNGGSGGTDGFYFRYNTPTYYSDAACTNQITNITRPTRAYYDYDASKGYRNISILSGGSINERYVSYDSVIFASDLHYDIYTDATFKCEWVGKVYTITLDPKLNVGGNVNPNTTGTTTIYERYNTGFYLDSACTIKMEYNSNPITKPTKTNYNFYGYWTEKGGKGSWVIENEGYINTPSDKFTSNTTLYASWQGAYFEDNFNAHAGLYSLKINGTQKYGKNYDTGSGITFSFDWGDEIEITLFGDCGTLSEFRYTDLLISGNFSVESSSFSGGYHGDSSAYTTNGYVQATLKTKKSLTADTAKYTIRISVIDCVTIIISGHT